MCVRDRAVNPGDLTVKLIGSNKDGLFFRQFVVGVNSVAFENPVVTADVGAEESLPVSEFVGIQILFGQDSDVRAKEPADRLAEDFSCGKISAQPTGTLLNRNRITRSDDRKRPGRSSFSGR